MKVFYLIISLALTYGAGLERIDVEFPFQKDHRIIGGHPVSITKHPHQISLRYRQLPIYDFTHICGGSIYNEYAIITAAHCMIDNEEAFLVAAGSDVRDSSDGARSLVRKIVKHPLYNVSIDNSRDVAIMFLETPLPLNNITMAAIPLATERPVHGQKAITTGWGRTEQGGDPSNKLMEVEIPIIQNEICSIAYKPQVVSHDMLCAGVLVTGGKDSCQGDSGGPLLVDHKLAGIVSWGIGCALGKYPGIYTNIYEFRDWIKDTVEQNKV